MKDLRERLMETMLLWGGSMSDLMGEEGLEEWVDDLEQTVMNWIDETKESSS